MNTVLGVARTTQVHLSNESDVSTAVAIVAAAADIRIAQVGVVETASPAEVALSYRDVAFVIPETGVALDVCTVCAVSVSEELATEIATFA